MWQLLEQFQVAGRTLGHPKLHFLGKFGDDALNKRVDRAVDVGDYNRNLFYSGKYIFQEWNTKNFEREMVTNGKDRGLRFKVRLQQLSCPIPPASWLALSWPFRERIFPSLLCLYTFLGLLWLSWKLQERFKTHLEGKPRKYFSQNFTKDYCRGEYFLSKNPTSALFPITYEFEGKIEVIFTSKLRRAEVRGYRIRRCVRLVEVFSLSRKIRKNLTKNRLHQT